MPFESIPLQYAKQEETLYDKIVSNCFELTRMDQIIYN